MTSTNTELVQLMQDLHLNEADVARHLDVPLDVVNRWMKAPTDQPDSGMPESELRLLKFALMSDNRRAHLF